jgi:hypothetical protein
MLIPSENALAASLSSASGRQITPIVADVNNKLDLASQCAHLSCFEASLSCS